MPDLGPHWRSLTTEALQLLSSEREQLEYERAVPAVDTTSELVSIWFDQVYHPDYGQYCEAFTTAELDALRDFHDAFDKAIDELPESHGTVKNWLCTPTWKNVMKNAESTLAFISQS